MFLMVSQNLSFALGDSFSADADNQNHDLSHSVKQSQEDREQKTELSKKLPAVSKKTVSITIDDLPFVGEYRNFHLNMMIETMAKEQVPATGFIIAREVRKDSWEILRKFRDAGFGLGNHTFSHANLNKMSTQEYIQEIKGADHILHPVLTEPKYFRYPYLAMSSGQKKKTSCAILPKKITMLRPLP